MGGLMMSTIDPAINHYLSEYARVEKTLVGHSLPRLQHLRQTALAKLITNGFPTTRDEMWRYTNIAPFLRRNFTLAPAPANSLQFDSSVSWNFPGDHYRLVFIDGYFSPTLSHINDIPAGVIITNLAQGFLQQPDLISQHLEQCNKPNATAFTQLNTAFINDGAFIYLPAKTVVEKPIQLLFIATTTQEMRMASIRNLIIAEPNSQAHIIEHYLNVENNLYFTNTSSEIMLSENACIQHYKLIQENNAAFHIGTVQTQQQTYSRFTSHAITLSGGLVRSDTNVQLAAEYADCTLNGLYLLRGQQHVDHNTLIEHMKPHGTSREYYKGVLTGHSRAIFNGRIYVHPDAQKTSAQQTNKNLLLSENAEVDTRPTLQIYADDVQCTHGATVGQLDTEALFYLRSRGLDENAARDALIHAFVGEMLERITLTALRDQLYEQIQF